MNVLESLRHAFRRAREAQPGFTESMEEEALLQILAALGGERVIIPKTAQGRRGKPGIPLEVQQRAYRDGLTAASAAEVTARHGISRAYLYRLMKKGPGGEGGK